nr:PREDICTED: 4-hydroxy-2-oxoglutarate aldolase, mitochondrial-like isoform X1 [Bemisia tabaci]XP_018898134.1 PREDICTED: 4-hydroxy-2-oxoglutarate aldolase, mitochondrial-like isoform X1 [Bemisia tabaci]
MFYLVCSHLLLHKSPRSYLPTMSGITTLCQPHQKRNLSFDGIFPALPTPFDKDENIDFDALKKNLARWEKIPFKGYVVGGSYSEAPSVDPGERLAIVKETRKVISDSKILIGGSSCLSTKATCELSKSMGEAGADAVMVLLPFYYRTRLNEEAIIDHFTTVANASPVPLVIYNNPLTTGVDIPISAYIKLAAHPNIVAVKDGDVSKLSGTKLATHEHNFAVLSNGAGFLVSAMVAGAVGSINSLGAILGETVCEVHQLVSSGQYDEAIQLQMKLVEPDLMLRMTGHSVPGMKAAMDILGYYGGPVRKPLQPLNNSDREKVKECLKKSGFI